MPIASSHNKPWQETGRTDDVHPSPDCPMPASHWQRSHVEQQNREQRGRMMQLAAALLKSVLQTRRWRRCRGVVLSYCRTRPADTVVHYCRATGQLIEKIHQIAIHNRLLTMIMYMTIHHLIEHCYYCLFSCAFLSGFCASHVQNPLCSCTVLTSTLLKVI